MYTLISLFLGIFCFVAGFLIGRTQRKKDDGLCCHLWKEMNKEYLRESREEFAGAFGIPHYSNFKYYAVTYQCVNCPEKKVVEQRTMII